MCETMDPIGQIQLDTELLLAFVMLHFRICVQFVLNGLCEVKREITLLGKPLE